MNFAALRNEIITDPLHLGYAPYVAAGADQAVADILNRPNPAFTATNPYVPMSLVGIWCAKNGVRAKVEAAALNTASPVQGICLMIRDMLVTLNGPHLDLSDADNLAMCDILVAAGVLVDGSGATLKPSLLALQNVTPASRAQVLGGIDIFVSHTQVAVALGRGTA